MISQLSYYFTGMRVMPFLVGYAKHQAYKKLFPISWQPRTYEVIFYQKEKDGPLALSFKPML